MLHALAALGAFVLVLTPWVVRNFAVSGTPFGTAGFAVAEGTLLFPQFQLERAIHPDLGHLLWLTPYLHKLLANGQSILTNDLTRFGGSWATLLFWAGLLLSFRSVAVRRLRYFLLLCLGTFVVVQALGQTQLSVESPEVNSENLLVLLAPLAFIYGVSLFLTLLEQMNLPALQLRYPIIAAFAVLSCLPMIFALLPPKTSPVTYPPYYPPEIQQTAGWMKENELMMSDVPWAVAWYGQRQCVVADAERPGRLQRHQFLDEAGSGGLSHAGNDGQPVRFRLGEDPRIQLGQFHSASGDATPNPARFSPAHRAQRIFAGTPVPDRPRTLETDAALKSRRRPPQPVGDAGPLRQIRRRLDDNPFRAGLVAAVQLRVNRPRKRLRVARNHAHPREIFDGGNLGVRDDVTG